jgi:hypothetical protein
VALRDHTYTANGSCYELHMRASKHLYKHSYNEHHQIACYKLPPHSAIDTLYIRVVNDVDEVQRIVALMLSGIYVQ